MNNGLINNDFCELNMEECIQIEGGGLVTIAVKFVAKQIIKYVVDNNF